MSKFKVGDEVKVINDTCGHGQIIGGVITLNDNDVQVERNAWHFKESAGYITECDFEPYTEPEKAEPEYLNMRVVCVESDDGSFTVGKVYEFKDGLLEDNQGTTRPHYLVAERIKSLSDEYLRHWPYKFIEFKGE